MPRPPGKTIKAPQRKRIAKRPRRKSGPRAKAAGTGDSCVVYVHGVGRHAPPAELKLQWDMALFGRDMGERSLMAYWADLVHPEATAPTVGAKRRKSDDGMIDLDRALRGAGHAADNEAARAFAQALLRDMGVTDEPPSGRPGKKVLPLPAFLRKPVSRAFLEAFVHDTAAYFFTPNLRRRICDRLVEQLRVAAPRSVTIVAHSQGSVIAYEVLSALSGGDVDLDALVTMGSPLGLREVQDFLKPGDLSIPSVVARWNNFADPLDPVALDKGLGNDFASPQVAIQDELIVNTLSRNFANFNPHAAVGYLAHPKVRQAVNDAMRLDVMARFVIARDVAERLDLASDVRNPVLIEVLEPGYPAVDEDEETMAAAEARERNALPRLTGGGEPTLALEHRIANAAAALDRIVTDKKKASIDPLRRFVAARLTAGELVQVGAAHKELRVYAVWRSARKAKLTDRSMRTLKADAAFASFGADGRDITWAVLDTGVQSNHPHFAGVLDAVWDCTRPGAPRKIDNARDADGHGTHVAGIIAGRAAAGAARGVAPKAKLVVYKVLDDNGEGEDAWIIKALDHIAEQNANVASGVAIHGLNLSLGGPFDNTVYGCGFSPVCAELRRLWRDGVLVVVACGNEGTMDVQTADGEVEINSPMSIGDPANLEDCVAVGSINADRPHLYGVSSFSSRGPTADGRVKPDVVAPGERILSCNARFRGDRNLYYRESGTSMAAPHVSGLLAAFLSVRREYRGRPDEVKEVLLKSCIDLGRDRYHQGHGLPNLMQMLLAV